MLLDEERYDDAYDAFQLILKKSPKNAEGQLAIIKIANQYFDQKDFNRALKIYKEAERRWPSLVNNTPIIFNNMAEIYFQQKKYYDSMSVFNSWHKDCLFLKKSKSHE